MSDYLLLFIFLLRVFWLNNTAKLKNIIREVKGKHGETSSGNIFIKSAQRICLNRILSPQILVSHDF